MSLFGFAPCRWSLRNLLIARRTRSVPVTDGWDGNWFVAGSLHMRCWTDALFTLQQRYTEELLINDVGIWKYLSSFTVLSQIACKIISHKSVKLPSEGQSWSISPRSSNIGSEDASKTFIFRFFFMVHSFHWPCLSRQHFFSAALSVVPILSLLLPVMPVLPHGGGPLRSSADRVSGNTDACHALFLCKRKNPEGN